MDILFNPLSLSEDDIEQLRSVLNVERFTRLLAVALPTLPSPDESIPAGKPRHAGEVGLQAGIGVSESHVQQAPA